MRVAAVCFGMLVAAAAAAAQSGAEWEYAGKRGPLVWGKLDPTYKACSQGHAQSPIDIRGAHLNKALAPIEFHYVSGAATLENDGHTILVHASPASYIVAGGARYQLDHLEFHHPSETAVKGRLTELEVDLVHKSADGKQAVVALRFKEDRGAPNAVFAALFPHLPATAGATAKVPESVNPAGLLPADRAYWTYTGSLTTPPCTEGVAWFVLEEEQTVSREQLRAYMSLFRVTSRPLQEMHGRRIEATQ